MSPQRYVYRTPPAQYIEAVQMTHGPPGQQPAYAWAKQVLGDVPNYARAMHDVYIDQVSKVLVLIEAGFRLVVHPGDYLVETRPGHIERWSEHKFEITFCVTQEGTGSE